MITILGVETSCDETGIGIAQSPGGIKANAVASSLERHAPFGGVIPEIAARAHVESLRPALDAALSEARVGLADLDAVAVTYGPGLPGALLIGLAFAKGLACALNKPLIPVDHLAAHLYAAALAAGNPKKPCLGLLVSGGHTLLCLMRPPLRFELLGQTRDDAAGEAFDKVAKMMGLGYPGGPVIDRLARSGDPAAIPLTQPQTKHRYDFSFSGLKTGVLRVLRERAPGKRAADGGIEPAVFDVPERLRADLAASFQEAAVSMIVRRTLKAAREYGTDTVLTGGGVMLNSRLREALNAEAAKAGIRIVYPEPAFCADNGAMVAAAGCALFEEGLAAPLALGIDPGLCLTPYAGASN